MKLLTVAEVADILSVSQATVYALCAANDLPHVRIGRSARGTIRIAEADVLSYLESKKIAATTTTPPPRPDAQAAPGFSELDRGRLAKAWKRN